MFKILWLDDDFLPITDTIETDLKEKRERLHKAISDANLFGFEVDAVPFFDEFQEKIKHYQQYQVVVLDLKGLDRNDSSNNRVFPEAQKAIQGLPLATYVYSGTRNDDSRLAFYLEDFEKNGGVIVSKNEDIPTFFSRIKKDLEIKPFARYYKGHEYCMELISEGFLNSSDQILGAMNNILRDYHERDILSTPYNYMRIVLENMLNQLANNGEIKLALTPVESNKRFNERLSFIARYYHKKKDSNEYDFDNPVYPFAKCPLEIKIALRFIGDVANTWSHFIEEHPDYLQKGELSGEYNIHIQSAAYDAFFVALKWYLGRRRKMIEEDLARKEVQKKQESFINNYLKDKEPSGLKIVGKIELDSKGRPIKK